MNILITGRSGYIATSLRRSLKHNITCIGRDDFDLTDTVVVDSWFKDKQFDVVIHTAIAGGKRTKKDSGEDFYQNLLMFYNLYKNRSNYNKFINLGSGAEQNINTPYGLSKRIIFDLIKNNPNFFTIRIFGLFDENELEERFIKQNIRRYINKKSIVIYKDKKMDFFYMEDFIKLIEYYINTDSLPLEVNCTYAYSYKLSEIANIINNLADYSVPILIEHPCESAPYAGVPNNLFSFKGLDYGISRVYNKLKNQKSSII